MTAEKSNALVVASVATEGGAMTVEQIKANRELVRQAMHDLMEPGVHYGKIPGSDKPSLLKPGAELLCVVFRVAVRPEVDDLSGPDFIRYRVTTAGVYIPNGVVIGHGLGECSTLEDKYNWRAAKNKWEWEETPSDRRRWKWKGDRGEEDGVNQVRTNPHDAANTVLKMAKKRSHVDLVLSFTAASDVFAQDLEDIAEWLREKELAPGAEPTGEPGRGKAGSRPPQTKAASSNGPAQSGAINTAQLAVLKGAADGAGVPESDLLKKFEVDRLEALPFSKLNDALLYCKKIHEER